MRVVFVLDNGRTIEADATQVQLTCPDPNGSLTQLCVNGTDGTRIPLINFTCRLAAPAPEEAPKDATLEWLEELWRLEDKRGQGNT